MKDLVTSNLIIVIFGGRICGHIQAFPLIFFVQIRMRNGSSERSVTQHPCSTRPHLALSSPFLFPSTTFLRYWPMRYAVPALYHQRTAQGTITIWAAIIFYNRRAVLGKLKYQFVSPIDDNMSSYCSYTSGIPHWCEGGVLSRFFLLFFIKRFVSESRRDGIV